MSKKLLVIFGATGNQGGSIAHTVLTSPTLSTQYSVRVISRTPDNPKLSSFRSAGAEVASADTSDASTLAPALNGAHTVFAVTTTYYGPNSKAVETAQARALVDAAVSAGVQYIIWSSMSHPYEISSGKLTHVEHFDIKAEIEQYIRGLPVKSSFYAPGSFMQNFLTPRMAPRKSESGDGTYVLANPARHDTKLPLIDITDSGKFVAAILEDPEKYEGKFFAAAERLYSYDEIVEVMSRVTGKTVVHQYVPDDVFRQWLPEGTKEMLGEMFVLFRDYGYYGEGMKESVDWAAEQAIGKLTGLEEFLRRDGFKLE